MAVRVKSINQIYIMMDRFLAEIEAPLRFHFGRALGLAACKHRECKTIVYIVESVVHIEKTLGICLVRIAFYHVLGLFQSHIMSNLDVIVL